MPELLDVAIGTLFVFLLFSLVVSALNEYILSLTDQRAKFLRLGLAELFGVSKPGESFLSKIEAVPIIGIPLSWLVGFVVWLGKCLVTLGGLLGGNKLDLGDYGDALLSHGLLNAFSRSDNGGTSPSYIPAGAFVTGLLDVLLTKRGIVPAQWTVDEANALVKLVRAAQAAKNPGPVAPAKYDQVLNDFVADYDLLNPVPVAGSTLDQLSLRVRHTLAKTETKAAKTTTKTALTGAADFNAAKGLIPTQPLKLRRLLNALAAQADSAPANEKFNRLKALLNDFDAAVTVDLANELTAIEGAASGAMTLMMRPAIEHTAETIRSAIDHLPPGSKLQQSLQSLYRVTEGDVQKFKNAVEGWFNGVMERVTGWYKRFAQKWMIVIGFVLAAIFNVDTIEIVRVLSNNPNLAKAVATQAKTYVSKEKSPLSSDAKAKLREERSKAVEETEKKQKFLKELKEAEDTQKGAEGEAKKSPSNDKKEKGQAASEKLKELSGKDKEMTEAENALTQAKENIRLLKENNGADTSKVKEAEDTLKKAEKSLADLKDTGARLKAAGQAADQAKANADALNADALKNYQTAVAKLQGTGTPIGWTKEFAQRRQAVGVAAFPKAEHWYSEWGSKLAWAFNSACAMKAILAGWLLTAMAASLGAPFWFDLLSRFVNIRAAGKPPGEKEPTSTPTRPLPASIDTTPGTHAPAR